MSLQEKIENFAEEWLHKTGRESLTETMLGFDFTQDCYQELSDEEKKGLQETEFLDLLQKEVAKRF